jgi:hypothetical protein
MTMATVLEYGPIDPNTGKSGIEGKYHQDDSTGAENGQLYGNGDSIDGEYKDEDGRDNGHSQRSIHFRKRHADCTPNALFR